MARKQNPNLEVLVLAVERLGALADEMVFLGGCATGLLITDPASPPIRETRDVDAMTNNGRTKVSVFRGPIRVFRLSRLAPNTGRAVSSSPPELIPQ